MFESNTSKVDHELYSDELFDVRLVPIDERRLALRTKYTNWLKNEYLFTGNWSSDVLLNESVSGESLERIKRRLKRNYKIRDWQLDVNTFCNDIEGYCAQRLLKNEVPICIPDIEKNREIIINIFDQEGYYLINEIPSEYDEDCDAEWLYMFFAPKEQKNIFYWVKDTNYIYHTTAVANVDDIKKHGIIPKSSGKRFKYRPRIYFFIEEDKSMCYEYAEELYRLNKESGPQYALIKVDVSLLPDESHFYFDPMIENAIFTIDIIHPECIADIEYFDVNKVEFDNTYVPTQKELENQEKAFEIIKAFQKTHPQIKHSHQFVSAPLAHTNDLKELWLKLRDSGIYCAYFGKTDDGHAFMMDFRKY